MIKGRAGLAEVHACIRSSEHADRRALQEPSTCLRIENYPRPSLVLVQALVLGARVFSWSGDVGSLSSPSAFKALVDD